MNLRPAPLLATAASLALGLLTARAADADSDGLEDSVETATGVYLSLNNTGTNPNAADTDGDGVPDGLEVKEGTSPVDPAKFNSFSRGLMAYYPFDNGPNDLSGKGYHGVLLGNTKSAADRTGQANASYEFDGNKLGSNGQLSTVRVASAVLQSSSNYSISGWFNSRDVTQQYQMLFNTIPHPGVALSLNHPTAPGRLSFWVGSSTAWHALGHSGAKSDYKSNQWYQFVFTKSGQTYKLYVDGALSRESVVSQSATYTTAYGWRFSAIGDDPAYPIYTEVFNGRLDDFRIYNRALLATEVSELWVRERPRFQIIQGAYNWQSARIDAEARGGRLAVLQTQTKMELAQRVLNGAGSWPNLWIGLTDEAVQGEWRWLDGDLKEAGKWSAGEPSNTSGEDYAQIVSSLSISEYLLSDNHGSKTAGYLFERQPLWIRKQPVMNGRISGIGDAELGETATFTATPAPGYVFSGWTGDFLGNTNPLFFIVQTNVSIGATFSPDLSDADNDGLTAFDEITIHHTDPAKADTDGDGLTDGWELGIGRYSVVSGGMNWLQAKADASAKGGTLATFATEREWNFALQSIGSGALFDISGLWIGATDQAAEGIWTWITGEPFTFANWATGQPDNLNDSHFAAVSGDLGGDIGKWYDFRGSTLRDGYILEMGYATNPTNPDCDNDGLSDGEEQLAGSNPFLPDTDGDGLTDFQEVRLTKTHPNSADTNGNGINDADDDQDGDTLSNRDEITRYFTDPTKADTDGDSLNDNVELAHPSSYYTLVPGSFTQPQAAADATANRGRLAQFAEKSLATDVAYRMRRFSQGHLWIGLSDATTEGLWQWSDGTQPTFDDWLTGQPDGGTNENHAVLMASTTQWADAAAAFTAAGYVFERVGLDPLDPDTDADGLPDGIEVLNTFSDPTLDDSDGDGLSDGDEVNTHGSSPLEADTDEDGLDDKVEVTVHHTSPTKGDTDEDGFDDLFEVNSGYDPTKASSTPDAVSGIQTAVKFWFNAANGVSYRIEASTDLATWEVVEPSITGQGKRVVRFYDIENQPKRYFRAKRN